jgi:uncharacterized protein YbjT (DUF2867 family)
VILVAGGTGTLGAQLVTRLVERGARVRVLTRNRARGRALPGCVDLAVGDVRQPETLATAVRGCGVVVSAVHGFVGAGRPSPEAVDRDGNRNLVAAAAAAAIRRFVLVSGYDVRSDHPMSLHRAKFAAEETLRKSGVPFTIVRPTSFVETWIRVIGAKLAARGEALVFGPGVNPINFVSVRDVAALVALAACDDGPAGRTIDIAGPEDIGFTKLAERLIAASGKPGRIKHVPLAALRVLSWLARPVAPVFARMAEAAVIMNTTDFTASEAARAHLPSLPVTRIADVVGA